jgi:3-oxoacyl-(acyl-carrier-protein) synthase
MLKNTTGINLTNIKSLSPDPVYVSLYNRKRFDELFKPSENGIRYTDYEKLLIYSIQEALVSSKVEIDNKDTLLILSTVKGNIDLLQPEKNKLWEPDRVRIGKSSELIRERFNHPNQPITVSNACISGTLAIIIAKRLLDSGKYKHAVIAGADILPEFTLSGFQVFKAVGNSPCKPFDKNRDGMTPGEGAGTIILTTDPEKAGKPLIYITGGACGNDANHISGPSKTGEEPAATINKSLKEAGLSSSDIDFISAHGTATLYNDESEAKAFGLTGLSNVPVNSFKGYIGHTFGAAGIIETILSIESMKKNILLKSYGFEEQGTENKLNIITKNHESGLDHILKTASGFGGSNAALVIGKENRSGFQPKEVSLNVIGMVKLMNNQLFIDGNEQKIEMPESDTFSIPAYLKGLYKHLNINYPKFFKMDVLSKTAFLTCEYLLKDKTIFDKFKGEEIAVILSNGSSSLNTDADYQTTINDRTDYFPSPAVFVYTLPNIMAGEICIRHKISGENSVFISENYNKEFIFDYVKILFETGNTKIAIAGRVEHSFPDGNIFSELYLIENNK